MKQKQFIIVKNDGLLCLGTSMNEGYDFEGGWQSMEDILSGINGNDIEVLSRAELQDRIQDADERLSLGF